MMGPTSAAPESSLPVILRVVLAVACLVPAGIGLLVIATIFATFLYEGFRFEPSDEVWMQLFIGAAALLVLLPAIGIGVILRYARWKGAPAASLALGIIVGAAGIVASGMLRATVVEGDTESHLLLMAVSAAGIVLGALPPFLHWWNARATG